jgi:hypothetical protein
MKVRIYVVNCLCYKIGGEMIIDTPDLQKGELYCWIEKYVTENHPSIMEIQGACGVIYCQEQHSGWGMKCLISMCSDSDKRRMNHAFNCG